MTGEATSGTVTVLFTDIVGSTELMTRLGEAAFDRLRRDHFSRLRAALAATGGTEVKNTGDGLMATFASAVGAVRAPTRWLSCWRTCGGTPGPSVSPSPAWTRAAWPPSWRRRRATPLTKAI